MNDKILQFEWIPYIYSQMLLKIQNNSYQFFPVENVDFGEEKQSS